VKEKSGEYSIVTTGDDYSAIDSAPHRRDQQHIAGLHLPVFGKVAAEFGAVAAGEFGRRVLHLNQHIRRSIAIK